MKYDFIFDDYVAIKTGLYTDKYCEVLEIFPDGDRSLNCLTLDGKRLPDDIDLSEENWQGSRSPDIMEL